MSADLWVVVNYLEDNPDHPLISGCVPNKITLVPYPLPPNKTKTVLRSKSSPANGGYNELSIEDRAGQELIYLRAQRDMEQMFENDSRLEVGNERRETIKGNSIAVLEAEEQRTVNADRKVHLKAGAHLILDAGASITLKGGDQHIVIAPGGIFSSSKIQIGGTPASGTAAAPVLTGMLDGVAVAVTVGSFKKYL